MYSCYILESEHHSYVGSTNNISRRLRQHNGEIVGGAKANRGKKSWFAAVVSGFPDQRSALQFEWALKHFRATTARIRQPGGRASQRVAKLAGMIAANKACAKCATGCRHSWDWTRLVIRVIPAHVVAVGALQNDERLQVGEI